MTILVWLIIGGVAGWLASKVVNQGKGSGPLTNIIVGIMSAKSASARIPISSSVSKNKLRPSQLQHKTPQGMAGVFYMRSDVI